MLNEGADPRKIEAKWLLETKAFQEIREPFLLY